MTQVKRIQRGTNGDLIARAQQFDPFGPRVLDLTPGDNLGFWTRTVPLGLHLLPAGHDYRTANTGAGTWTDVVFDPDYVATGGRKTSTLGEMTVRYGMHTTERTPALQWERKILPGVDAARRLLEPGGRLWWKLQDYVTASKNLWFTKLALGELDRRGFDLVRGWILDGHPGPQPTHTKCKPCKGLGMLGDLTLCSPCKGTGQVRRRDLNPRNAHSELLIAVKR